MGDGDYDMFDLWFDNIEFEQAERDDKLMLIEEYEYHAYRNQLAIYNKISVELVRAYYGDDFYFSDPLSPSQCYGEVVRRIIKDINKKKKNIFYRIWQKITKW